MWSGIAALTTVRGIKRILVWLLKVCCVFIDCGVCNTPETRPTTTPNLHCRTPYDLNSNLARLSCLNRPALMEHTRTVPCDHFTTWVPIGCNLKTETIINSACCEGQIYATGILSMGQLRKLMPLGTQRFDRELPRYLFKLSCFNEQPTRLHFGTFFLLLR